VNDRRVPNLIDGGSCEAVAGEWIEKRRPIDGELLCQVARSRAADVAAVRDMALA
jgi:acyl-CoA reductase-like NAD-dependent aldehyde dehydrogenase